ncbi:MAG TPA: nucleotidyltransferase family protein [Acidobacteriaceae bacterium]
MAKTIVAAFRGLPAGELEGYLRSHDLNTWNDTYRWLDTSGLELYFLARLKALALENLLPQPILDRMERNFADNKIRTAGIIQEFVRVNEALQREHLTYCNVKGIALAPVSCPELTLRRQLNLDFILSASEIERCRQVLFQLGYSATSSSRHFCEFHPNPDLIHPRTNIYQRTIPNSIAIYLVSGEAQGIERAPYSMLMRRQLQTLDGYTFPAPNEPDHFIAQAIRILGQVGIEWSRLAFLWEFKVCLQFRQNDPSFWQRVHEGAQEHPLRPLAIATAARLAAEIFGGDIPLPLRESAASQLDPRVRSWSERHGWDSILTGFPGTTLQTLLEQEMGADSQQ